MEKEIIQDNEVKRMIRDHERRGLTLKKTINLGETKKPELIEDKDLKYWVDYKPEEKQND